MLCMQAHGAPPDPKAAVVQLDRFAILILRIVFVVSILLPACSGFAISEVSPLRWSDPRRGMRSARPDRILSAKSDSDSKVDDSGSMEPLDEMPANLRRKVAAKRPALGHVVPSSLKSKKGGSANPRLRPQGKAREAGLNNPSMLRISAGRAKGRRLDSPNVYLRPMMGKVREAVFSTFTSFGLYEVDSTRHLDIFAGSGSVGLESLSRGATHCTFVDLSDDCCDAVKRNIDWCKFHGQGRVVCGEALSVLREPEKHSIKDETFQLVTMCPPYEEVVYGDLLEAAANSRLVADDTIVLIEYPIELGTLPHIVKRTDGGAMVGIRNRRYGRTLVAMYCINPTGRLEGTGSRPEEFISVK